MASTVCAMRAGLFSASSVSLQPRQLRQIAPHQRIAVLGINKNKPSGLRTIYSRGRVTCSVGKLVWSPSSGTLICSKTLQDRSSGLKRGSRVWGKNDLLMVAPTINLLCRLPLVIGCFSVFLCDEVASQVNQGACGGGKGALNASQTRAELHTLYLELFAAPQSSRFKEQ